MRIFEIIIFCVILFASCQRECGDLVYIDGLTYLNNKLYTGDCTEHFSSGQIRSQQSYLNGKDHGNWKFYHPGKIPQTIGQFENGVRIGIWKYYYSNGKIWKINNYDSRGKKIGEWITYAPDGSIDTLVTFSKNRN